MPSFAGDTVGQASQLFNNYEDQDRARMADAFNRMLTQNYLNRNRAVQQQQFQQQMQAAARQQAAENAYRQQALGIDAQRYGVESQWRNRQLDLLQRQLQDQENEQKSGGDLTPPQRTNLHIQIAQNAATSGAPDAPPGTVDPDWFKQTYNLNDDALAQSLADTANGARSTIQNTFSTQSRVANAGNAIPQRQAFLAQPAVVNQPSWGGYLNQLNRINPLAYLARWAGTTQPDTSWVAGQGDRLRGLQQSVAQAVQNGSVIRDPLTGSFVPATPQARWMAPAGNGLPTAGNRSVAGGFAPTPTIMGTNLPVAMPQGMRGGNLPVATQDQDPSERIRGQLYSTPMGNMVWTGTGWMQPNLSLNNANN